jgi:hypothetical protein
MQILVSNRGVFTFVSVAVSGYRGDLEKAKVQVPFDFIVGDRVLRAGIYEVEESGRPGLLRFHRWRNPNDQILVQTINNRSEAAIPEKLLFLVQQNTYYLGQALMAPE